MSELVECPKCHKPGFRNTFQPNKKETDNVYVRYMHGRKECYGGRLYTMEEGFSLINQPISVEEYRKNLKKSERDIKAYFKNYPEKSRLTKQKTYETIKSIMLNYGLWQPVNIKASD